MNARRGQSLWGADMCEQWVSSLFTSGRREAGVCNLTPFRAQLVMSSPHPRIWLPRGRCHDNYLAYYSLWETTHVGVNEPVVSNLHEAKSRADPMGVGGTATPLQGASKASEGGTGYRKHPENVSNPKQGEPPAKTSKRAKAWGCSLTETTRPPKMPMDSRTSRDIHEGSDQFQNTNLQGNLPWRREKRKNWPECSMGLH